MVWVKIIIAIWYKEITLFIYFQFLIVFRLNSEIDLVLSLNIE